MIIIKRSNILDLFKLQSDNPINNVCILVDEKGNGYETHHYTFVPKSYIGHNIDLKTLR